MLKHRIAAAAVTFLVASAALFGVVAPAHAVEIIDPKCPGSPQCVILVAPLGDCWEHPCSIQLRLLQRFSRDVTVRYATAPGTATEGVDYVGIKSGRTTIPAGKTAGYVDLTILPDERREPDETFALQFLSPSDGFTVEPSTVRIVIHDGR